MIECPLCHDELCATNGVFRFRCGTVLGLNGAFDSLKQSAACAESRGATARLTWSQHALETMGFGLPYHERERKELPT